MNVSVEKQSEVLEKERGVAIDDDDAARIYAALGHPVRVAILRQLILEEACCCKDIVGRLDLAQSTVSQHLKVLVQTGLIDYRPERQTSRYSVNRPQLHAICDHLTALTTNCCSAV
ncbi:metalloregulator ArsR/SmtB family transcription factor [Falsochrobactrum sp. TDYN1]|uniref:Metalloregulator ArsR/SmtB family transcription factor n=1 Tax=Falsochrobactrum tianjinense TaxID=2706015 RepID=A0A949PK50_9HYPH|nr:metalloregulator ArsR/SmtB family transcription factor [Falsochrobactrum sp. TDYN1]MBV2142536.1 metalloregulator ArsR/SmtB family transcription factor [Falsochrobactrum sp. TDYN1]